MASMEKLKKN